jgi:membrane-bound hydrogenase subunit mbhJ
MSLATWAFKKSPWVYHVGTAACNNCDIEILDCLTPRFDIERFGMVLVGSPRHADVLLVSGVCNKRGAERLRDVYRQTAKPCAVLCIGACAITGEMFRDSYYFDGPPDRIIKEVDPNAIIAYVPGCPPKPEAIISGAIKALSVL